MQSDNNDIFTDEIVINEPAEESKTETPEIKIPEVKSSETKAPEAKISETKVVPKPAKKSGHSLDRYENAINQLYNMISNSVCLPIVKKYTIDKDAALSLLDIIIREKPSALTQATEIIQQQKKLLDEARAAAEKAQREADALIRQTKQQAEANRQKMNSEIENMCNTATARLSQEIADKRARADADSRAIIADAQKIAQNITIETQSRVAKLISEENLVTQANLEASKIRAAAQQDVERLYREVYANLGQALELLDIDMAKQLENIRIMRQQLDHDLAQQP